MRMLNWLKIFELTENKIVMAFYNDIAASQYVVDELHSTIFVVKTT